MVKVRAMKGFLHNGHFTIQRLGPQGDGVHLGKQGRVFIERAVPGDHVRAKIAKDADGVLRGEIAEILEPSPYRRAAPCVHFDRCGNCTLQHLDLSFYRGWKSEVVQEAFRKQDLAPRTWLRPVFLGSQNRRRATFSACRIRGRIVLGYYQRRTQQIADIDSCLVADERILRLRERLKPVLSFLVTGEDAVDVFLQIVGEAIDMVITGPVGRQGKPDMTMRKSLMQLMESTPVSRIGWRSSEGEPIVSLLNKGPLFAKFGALKVNLPPAAFLQPTLEGEQVLVNAVLAALPAKGKFADLFSGCGTFSGPLLDRGSVDAYEMVPAAVKALSSAAANFPLKVFRRDLFRNPLRRDELNRYSAVVFDPPRGGCGEQASQMAISRVPLLIGVSCNPATFARDAGILCDGGYRLQSLQMVDQFLYSHHVEVVGVFTKRRRT